MITTIINTSGVATGAALALFLLFGGVFDPIACSDGHLNLYGECTGE